MTTGIEATELQPAWDHSNPALSVRLLFAKPYWIASDPAGIGEGWRKAMAGYQVYLDQIASVKEWGVTIYGHLRSRNMPKTHDPAEYWPDAATELLRLWINQGWRATEHDPFDRAERIPPPSDTPNPVRIRRDVRSLSEQELNAYRARIEDVLHAPDPSPDSPWQKMAYIHTNWCVHYQEAFLFWHRAYLVYFEQVLGVAVPYWNWMAEDADVDGSPNAGIPQAFLEPTYIHPVTGDKRPNPLRFAAAKDGLSKAYAGDAINVAPGTDCRWVQRNPLFLTKGDDRRAEREKLFRMVRIFQNQVVNALRWPVFSQPQGWPGYPWANILTFDPPQPDNLYPHRQDFDGLYEQPHDNWHGWIGADMADNAYTAFDPVFWSYHANIDRMMEVWIRAHPAAQFTSAFPIHPFIGSSAATIAEADPRPWRYTTIGDMARDSRAIGYDYGLPVATDWKGDATAFQATEPALTVVFNNVRCTLDSYTIDAFLNQSSPGDADVDPLNKHYIGRFSRIGMGIEDDKGRCIRHGVTRQLDATPNARALGVAPGSACELTLLVRKIATGEIVAPEVYRTLPGFEGRLFWSGVSVPSMKPPLAPVPQPSTTEGSCCAGN